MTALGVGFGVPIRNSCYHHGHDVESHCPCDQFDNHRQRCYPNCGNLGSLEIKAKVCSKCHVPKERDNDFPIEKRSPNAVGPWCYDCLNAWKRTYAKNNRAKENVRMYRWRAAHSSSVGINAFRRTDLDSQPDLRRDV